MRVAYGAMLRVRPLLFFLFFVGLLSITFFTRHQPRLCASLSCLMVACGPPVLLLTSGTPLTILSRIGSSFSWARQRVSESLARRSHAFLGGGTM